MFLSIQPVDAWAMDTANFEWLIKNTTCRERIATPEEYRNAIRKYDELMAKMSGGEYAPTNCAINTAILFEEYRRLVRISGGPNGFAAKYGHTLAPKILAKNFDLIYFKIRTRLIEVPHELKIDYYCNGESAEYYHNFRCPAVRKN